VLAFFVYLPKYPIMISITSVYRTLKSLANEEQKGFITPYSFNDFVETAQTNVYNEILSKELTSASVSRAQKDSSFRDRSKQQLSYFESYKNLVSDTKGEILLPENCNYVTYIAGNVTSETYATSPSSLKEVEIEYDIQRFNLLRNSNVSSGNHGSLLSSNLIMMLAYICDGKVKIANATSGSRFYVKYVRTPGSITYSGTKSASRPSLSFKNDRVDEENSLNFDLPPSFHSEVVNEMAKLVGIQLEETGVYSYGVSEETAREATKTN